MFYLTKRTRYNVLNHIALSGDKKMSIIKNALVLVAAIAVVGIYSLYLWCEQFVAVSMLQTVACKGCGIAVYRRAKPRRKPNYKAMSIRQLKQCCNGTGIKGWEKLRKAELVAALMAL